MSPERSNSGLDAFAASIWPSESTSLLLTDLQTRDLVLGYVGGALYSLHNRGAVMRTSVWRWGQWWSESCVSGVQWGLVRWWIQDSKGSLNRECPSPQVLFKPHLALCWLMPRLKGREKKHPSWLGSLKVKWQRPEINHHDHFLKKKTIPNVWNMVSSLWQSGINWKFWNTHWGICAQKPTDPQLIWSVVLTSDRLLVGHMVLVWGHRKLNAYHKVCKQSLDWSQCVWKSPLCFLSTACLWLISFAKET